MKKFLLSILFLFLSSSVFSIEVISSDSTALNHPGEYAIDGDNSRGWELDLSEEYGWITLKLEEPLDILGLKLEGNLSTDSEFYISYIDQHGSLQDFFSGFNAVPNESDIIDLSLDKVTAQTIFIRLFEKSDIRSSLSNVEIISQIPEDQIVKMEYDVEEASSNSSVYSPEYSLLDGKTGTYWRAENNLNWRNVQWAVKQFLDNRYEYEKEWFKNTSSYVDLDSDGTLNKLTIYSLDSGKGTWSLTGFDDDGNRTILASNMEIVKGWSTLDLGGKEYDKLRLQVDSFNSADFPKIGEVELWGVKDLDSDNDDPELQYLTPYYTPLLPYMANNNYFEWDREDTIPVIETIQNLSDTDNIELNGFALEPLNIVTYEKHRVVTYLPNDSILNDGYNFIDKENLLGVKLVCREDRGDFYNSSSILSNASLLESETINGERVINLDSISQLNRIEIYNVKGGTPVVYALVNDNWEALRRNNSLTDLSIGKIVYSSEIITDRLKIEQYGSIGEVKVWGSFEDIGRPEINILFPFNNIDLLSHEPGYSVFVAEISDEESDVTIGGVKAKSYGNIYWVEMKELKLPKSGIENIEIIAKGRNGSISSKSIDLILQHNGFGDEVTGDEVMFTRDDTVVIEGKSNQWRSKLFINGIEYSINGNDFSHELPLKEGFNKFKIEFKNKKGNVVKTFFKIVYRESSNIELRLLNDTVLTKDKTVVITGFVKGFGELSVDVNGEEAEVEGFTFVSDEISLSEGDNSIVIEAEDELGNSISKTLTVIKDSTSPTLSDIKPLIDTIISTDNVLFTGFVTEDIGVKVFVNGNISVLNKKDSGLIGFSKELSFLDGINKVDFYAVDKIGNRSETFSTQVVTDTTAPNSFAIYSNPTGWTNDTTPTITFNTTDDTTGVDYYQYKIGLSDSWSSAVSPFNTPVLKDGIHSLFVRATDFAGHSTTEVKKLYIDTTAPKAVEVFRTIPDRDSIELKWTPSVSKDTLKYKLVRTPSFPNGDLILTKDILSYTDKEVELGVSYSYSISTLDRALNSSEEVLGDSAIVGLEVKEYNNNTGSVVEYENIALIIPEESLPDDVLEIHVTEVESKELEAAANNIIIGPIYNASVVREINGERVLQDHISFKKNFLASLEYNEADFPDGFPEENIGVYYFDPMWNRWFKVENSAVDKENNKIYFNTNHFTDFSVQPTLTPSLSPQDYKSMGVSPFTKGHSSVNVDPQSGSVSMSVEEFTLPGKAGFDFTLRRTYSGTRARKDSFNMALAKSLGYKLNANVDEDIVKKLRAKGVRSNENMKISMYANLYRQYEYNPDYIYSMGAGWKLDLPGVTNTNYTINVTVPGGGAYAVNQMDLIDNVTSNNKRTLVFENHEGSDFTFIVKQSGKPLVVLRDELLGDGSSSKEYKDVETWVMYEAQLILKDGTTYKFDSLGRVTEKLDPYGINKIKFTYDGVRLHQIIDSMDREITFDYDDSMFVPLISEVKYRDFKGAEKSIKYNLVANGFMGQLDKATDVKGRVWDYDYYGVSLTNNSSNINVETDSLINNFLTPGGINSIAKEVAGVEVITFSEEYQAQWVDALKTVKGPGIGTTDIDYTAQSMLFKSIGNKDDYNGFYKAEKSFSYGMLETLLANKVVVKTNSQVRRVKSYDFNYEYSGNKEFTNKKTVVVDGKKKTVYHYKNFLKGRKRWMKVSDKDLDEEQKYGFDNIAKLNKTEIFDLSGKLIKTTNISYYWDSLKVQSRFVENSSTEHITISYIYDDWGNEVYTNRSTLSGDRTTFVENFTDYLGSVNEHAIDIPELKNYVWDTVNNKHIKNLVKSIVTKNYHPDGGYVSKIQAFDYTPTGRKATSSIYSDKQWLDTTYEYDLVGNLNKITTPENNITEYKWSYPKTGKFYTLEKTYKNVDNIDSLGKTEARDIKTIIAFEKNSGLKAWSTDGRGFTTEYSYDSLGRLTRTKIHEAKFVKPTNILISDTDLFQKISYNDAKRLTTVTDPMDKTSTYQYDNIGNLTRVTRYLDKRAINVSLKYDAWGNVVSIIDAKNNMTNYTYDLFNRNVDVIYPLADYGDSIASAAVKTQNYDYLTNTLTITDEDNNITYQKFDMSGNTVESGYFDSGLKKVLDKTYYDGIGNVVKAVDGEGNSVVKKYNERFQLSNIEMPKEKFFNPATESTVDSSSYIEYSYDKNGFKIGEIRNDFDGDIVTTYSVNALGQVLSTNIEGIINSISYDANGNNIYVIDGKGNVTSFVYDHQNNMKSQTLNGRTTKFSYDKLGNVTSMTDPRDKLYSNFGTTYSIDYHYDDLYRLTSADLPKSYGNTDQLASISFSYDDNGNVETKTNIDNIVTHYEYNNRNMLLEEYITSDSKSITKKFNNKYKLNKRGLVVENVDASAKSVITSYTELGQVDSVTIGNVTESFKYDLNGNVTQSTDGRGKVTTNYYDSYNRLKSVLNANGDTLRFGYDLNGNKTYFEDGNSNRTIYEFDKINRMIRERNSRGFDSKFEYDNVGNITKKHDFNGSEFTYIYDEFYNLDILSVKDVNAILRKSIDYTYDEVGNLKSASEYDYDENSVLDNSVTTSYNFVNGGYVSDPFNRIFNITTDVNGRVDSVDYSYDIAGRLTGLTYPDKQTISSNYNVYGQLSALGNYTQPESFNYLENGMLSSYTLGNGVIYSSNYDDNNRLDDFSYTKNSININSYDFTYDDSNNIVNKVVNSRASTYSYDDINQLVFAHNEGEYNVDPKDLDSPQNLGLVKEDYIGEESLDFDVTDTELKLDYNSISIGFDLGTSSSFKKFIIKPIEITNRLKKDKFALYVSDDNIRWRYVYSTKWKFDFVGNTAEIELNESIKTKYVKLHCLYDDLDEDGYAKDLSEIRNSKETLLTAFFTIDTMNETFSYDSAGNRESYDKYYPTIDKGISTTYSYYTNSNLIKTDSNYGYVWDKNGNLVQKGTTYNINSDDIVFSETSGILTEYNYDLLNRLVNVVVTNFDEPEFSNSVVYIYDHRGYRLKREEKDKRATYYTFGLSGEILYKDNLEDNIKENFIYLFNKHLAKEVSKNGDVKERLYFHTDHLGSTISITDSEGNSVWDNNYSAFGESLRESGSLDESGIYTGKEIDPVTGLFYFNARWYDANLGRLITEDPIKAGSNWYVYCLNNPLSFIDPTGLISEELAPAVNIDLSDTSTQTPEINIHNVILSRAELNDDLNDDLNDFLYKEAWKDYMSEYNPYINVKGYDDYEYHHDELPQSPVPDFIRISATDKYLDRFGAPMKEDHYTMYGNYAVDLVAPVGSPVMPIFLSGNSLTTVKYFLSTKRGEGYKWDGGIKHRVNQPTPFGGVIYDTNTLGVNFGFHIKLKISGDAQYKSVIFAHMRPDAPHVKKLEKLKELGRYAGYDDIPIPFGTHVGQVGVTGRTTGAHAHVEYER